MRKDMIIAKKEKIYSGPVEGGSCPLCQREKRVKRFLKGRRFKRLLDIGCGDCEFTLKFKGVAEELYGVDISKERVRSCRDKGVKAFCMDIDEEDVPFKEGYFDLVVCSEVVEHVFDSDHLLEEMYRVLSAEGLAVVTTPNLASYLNRVALLFGFQPYLTGTGFKYGTGKPFSKNPCPHLRLFTFKSFREILGLFGFEIISFWGEPHPGMKLPFSLVDKLFSKIPSLAVQLVFVVKKKKV